MKLQPFTLPDLLPAATPPTPPSKERNQQIIDRIGLVLRTVRKTRKYSLAEVETLSGVSASTVHRIETGESEPGVCTLLALERAFDLKPGWTMATAA
jgi:predicted transcriptional regulator